MDLEAIMRGDDITYELTIVDENGDPADVTGDDITMTFKADPKKQNVAMFRTIIPADGSSGVVGIPFTNQQTKIEAGIYYYDVQWTRTVSDNSAVVTLLSGKVPVLQDIT